MKSIALLSCLVVVGVLLDTKTTLAQTYQPSNRTPVADSTLGTQVSGTGNNFAITGGLNRGQTLFHSFTDFSIPTGGAANFNRPNATRDIITRVTGGSFSDLNGTLNSNGANFLLINPNGVVFGPNAQLNVGKAFAASTANGVDLIDSNGGRYTFGANRNGDAPLLSIDPNVFLNISRLNMGASVPNNPGIVNYGTLQTNNNSQYIGLIGGNVTLNGGKIIAPGGRVDLGGLNTAGTVSFSSNGLVFDGVGLIRGDVLFTNGTSVSVRATQTLGAVNTISNDITGLGSSIYISANNLNMLNAGAKSNTEAAALDAGLEQNSGTYSVAGGDISLNATGKVTLDNSNVKNTLRTGVTGNVGGIKIDAKSVELKNDALISTTISGRGNVGDIKIVSGGDVNVIDRSNISSDNIAATGNAGNITIETLGNINVIGTNDISLLNDRSTTTLSSISTSTNSSGKGNTGKIILTAQGDISFSNRSSLSSSILEKGEGNSQGIDIKNARNLTLTNNSFISTLNVDGSGDAGNIDIKTIGNINIIGLDPQSPLFTKNLNLVRNGFLSFISSNTNKAKGNTGKITIDTTGDINLTNGGSISSSISEASEQGNSRGIEIKNARNLTMFYQSFILTDNIESTGNAGNIDIKTSGDIKIIGADDRTFQINGAGAGSEFVSQISTNTNGKGNTGKISIDTTGNIEISNKGLISAATESNGQGNGSGIEIKNVRDLNLNNNGVIKSNTDGIGNAGNIDIKNIRNLTVANGSAIASDARSSKTIGNAGDINIQATGNIKVVGIDPQSSLISPNSRIVVSGISSGTNGKGDAGKISLDTTGDIEIANRSFVSSSVGTTGQGNSRGVEIKNARNLKLVNIGLLDSNNQGGKGNAGNIDIKTVGTIDIIGIDPQSQLVRDYPNLVDSATSISGISTASVGDGKAANISIAATRLNLNKGLIFSSGTLVSGGDINLSVSELLLLRNDSSIFTNSFSSQPDNNSGNITINSPLIVAISPSSRISTNAVGGNGGRVNITSQGLFGIQFIPKDRESSFTGSSITASSTFGRDGEVKIDTPGTDPGRDSTELPNATTDASNQISQACSASNRENTFTVTGRGGLPPNANDPLTGDVVWQDARANSTQPAVSSIKNTPSQLVPPAVGWIFDGKGKVTLIAAAGTQEQPTGASSACPKVAGQ
jgi:filamentous hemagglutinin family protein